MIQELKEFQVLGHKMYEKDAVDAVVTALDEKHEEEIERLKAEYAEKSAFIRELTGLEQHLYKFMDIVYDTLEYDTCEKGLCDNLHEKKLEFLRGKLKQYKDECKKYGVVNNGYYLHIRLPFDDTKNLKPFYSKPKVVFKTTPMFSPKTVMMGGKTWMAENLSISDTQGGIYYNEENGETYYIWDAAKRIADSIKGWHLPTIREWESIISNCSHCSRSNIVDLLSKDYGGLDTYGFGAKLVGMKKPSGAEFYEVGKVARFWTIDGYRSSEAWYQYMDRSSLGNITYHGIKDFALSVRLVKD